ncbi:carbonic anhydrase-like isoform X4 [Dreissena polymorpha]|uniref:carbonic anhydrase-like isoform X4 n=1 Tax=Dreissena polymorpha TaxID=45954 RepID=UPI002264B63A|nr:carbonic anhydrase-like isoform X4 [Dreissena polymorpha]XP_052255851.1 carbonic anhydrase-like isoform X4 [Dreissena polymorpha]XP_052255861.1 carbonic anhydrase-like isoform X4 [Dreissena polymorpha]
MLSWTRLTSHHLSSPDMTGSQISFLGSRITGTRVGLNDKTMMISGGGLGATFVAEQFHFHWGAVDERGSEHSVNGRHFPMEMHIVHFNKKYGNFSSSVGKVDGLAVLGFFFEIGRFNEHFQEIIDHFGEIQFKNQHININSIPMIDLMPARLTNYYRYHGSLTTPPCFESVTWTIFNETIEIAEEQLVEFRTTIFENDKSDGGVFMDISDDYRPVQCMFRRRLYASHPSLKYDMASPRENGNDGVSNQPTRLLFSMFLVCIWCILPFFSF